MQSYNEWESELKAWQKSTSNKLLGKNLILFADIGSTNKYLKENIQLSHGTLVLAYQQTKGKGQKDRMWISNKGGLYCSIKLDLNLKNSFQLFWVTASMSVGVCKALIQMGYNASIKWPNDILINNKKVAGILTESVISNEKIVIIIGFGCNVNNSLNDVFEKFPDLKTKISSLRLESETKEIVPIHKVLEPTLSFLETELQNNNFPIVSKIKDQWLKYCKIENSYIEIQQLDNGDIITGLVTQVTNSGSLLIKEESGFISEFTSGEIRIKR